MHNQNSTRKISKYKSEPKNLLHTPAPGLSYGWIKFPTVLCTGWSPLGSFPLRNVLSPYWFKSKSHGNHKIHSQHTHHPQPSPPTHDSQYADDSCVLRGEEMLAGPRLRSGRDDLWAGLNGTAQHFYKNAFTVLRKVIKSMFTKCFVAVGLWLLRKCICIS